MIVDNSTIAANKTASIVTTKVTDMSSLFNNSNFNGDISHWDTSNVTNMYRMFRNDGSFNRDIGSWDTSSLTNMDQMFVNASSFNLSLIHI